MKVTTTELPGVFLLDPVVHGDERGFFMETRNEQTWGQLEIPSRFVQDNHSGSAEGVLRGIHYQLKRPQGKLLRVIRGAVVDVAVDLRRSSPHFRKWVALQLSAENRRMVWIPPGFGHGFRITEGPAEVIYQCTEVYDGADSRAIRWDDPDLAVDWDLPAGAAPILSPADADAPFLADAEVYP